MLEQVIILSLFDNKLFNTMILKIRHLLIINRNKTSKNLKILNKKKFCLEV